MEGSVVQTTTEKTSTSIDEVLSDMCAYYLAIGCPYESFWYGDTADLKIWVQKDELEKIRRNQDMWVQGLYNYHAISAVAGEVLYAIGGRKGQKPSGYDESPIPFTEVEQKIDLERRKKKTREWFMKGQGNG